MNKLKRTYLKPLARVRRRLRKLPPQRAIVYGERIVKIGNAIRNGSMFLGIGGFILSRNPKETNAAILAGIAGTLGGTAIHKAGDNLIYRTIPKVINNKRLCEELARKATIPDAKALFYLLSKAKLNESQMDSFVAYFCGNATTMQKNIAQRILADNLPEVLEELDSQKLTNQLVEEDSKFLGRYLDSYEKYRRRNGK